MARDARSADVRGRTSEKVFRKYSGELAANCPPEINGDGTGSPFKSSAHVNEGGDIN